MIVFERKQNSLMKGIFMKILVVGSCTKTKIFKNKSELSCDDISPKNSSITEPKTGMIIIDYWSKSETVIE